MNKKKLFIILLIILIILGGANNKKKKQTNVNNATTIKTYTVPDGQVGIVSHKMTTWNIEVIIKNNTHEILKNVKVTATCWDKDGNNLGTASNGQYNINTNDNYKIEILQPSGTTRYTLSLTYNE